MSAAPTILPILPDLLEQAIARQPAAVRADWTWQANALREALRRLATEPLHAALVDEVSAKVLIAIIRVMPVLADQDAALMSGTSAEISRRVLALRDALAAADVAEALHWSWQQLLKVIEAMAVPARIATVTPGLAQLREEDARSMLATHWGSLFRAEVLIMGCLEGVETGVARETLRDLAWRAFDEMCTAQDALAAEGFSFSGPRDSGTSVPSILRAAQGVRRALTAADMKHLRTARVGELR